MTTVHSSPDDPESTAIRGRTIRLSDVVAAIRACSGVRDAAVVTESDDARETRLVAYVVMDDERVRPARSLRPMLLDALPAHAIPTRIVALQEMPVTPDGAVDPAALSAAYGEVTEFTHDFVAPRTREELDLSRIWATAFNMSIIGIDDDFFELGGQSLHAMQIATQVQEVLGTTITLDLLFRRPTIRSLAEALAGAHKESSNAASVDLR